jgi:glycosyltransferase involved in cell wall biosynthesis
LNIALDATYSLDPDLSGVGVYSRKILFGLAHFRPEQSFLFCYRTHRIFRSLNERLPENVSRALLRKSGISPWRGELFHGLNQRIDEKPSRRTAATFHDLFVLTDEFSPAEFRKRFAEQARGAAARSDLIIAISQFTADQVRDLLNVEAARIRVIHHGATAPAIAPPGDAERENIILHVGAIQKRKNIVRLVEAFERLPGGWRLVLAGSAGYGADEILARIDRSPKRESIDWLGYVDARRLESLYARARVFAFASLAEGFGMPLIDAMARGVPALASSQPALREVGGDAALYAEAESVDSLAHQLQRLIESIELRDQLRRAGLTRSAAFTWDSAVERTWRVYEELL